ncbi:MAG: hypothetical protein Q8N16_02645 [bacterium]|nr:hypothetical protein [bacterium]
MATIVTGGQYYGLDGQLLEIKRQLRQPNGYPFDPEELKLHLQKAIEGCFGGTPAFSRDLAKSGWDVIENAQLPWPIAIANLELVSFLGKNEKYISSEEVRRRAKELGANLGQRHAEYLLEHHNEIPAEWQKFCLIFAGTVWRHPDDNLYVPYLCWRGGMCDLNFFLLGCDWDSRGRLVRQRK